MEDIGVDECNIKMACKGTGCNSVQGQVANTSENANEPSDSIKCREFLNLQRKYCTLWS
jgi:hypothetical protein